jgi:hypothetical protein
MATDATSMLPAAVNKTLPQQQIAPAAIPLARAAADAMLRKQHRQFRMPFCDGFVFRIDFLGIKKIFPRNNSAGEKKFDYSFLFAAR